MGLFGKRKEDTGSPPPSESNTPGTGSLPPLDIKILGSGCAKCNALEVATIEALEQLGIDAPIDHVTDFAQIASYGVMSTPALVVNRKVVSVGKVLKPEEIVKILQNFKR